MARGPTQRGASTRRGASRRGCFRSPSTCAATGTAAPRPRRSRLPMMLAAPTTRQRSEAAVDAATLLATLPEPQREVIVLRYYHDFSEDAGRGDSRLPEGHGEEPAAPRPGALGGTWCERASRDRARRPMPLAGGGRCSTRTSRECDECRATPPPMARIARAAERQCRADRCDGAVAPHAGAAAARARRGSPRPALWRKVAAALLLALVPLPAVLAYDAYLLRCVYELVSALLPATLAALPDLQLRGVPGARVRRDLRGDSRCSSRTRTRAPGRRRSDEVRHETLSVLCRRDSRRSGEMPLLRQHARGLGAVAAPGTARGAAR